MNKEEKGGRMLERVEVSKIKQIKTRKESELRKKSS